MNNCIVAFPGREAVVKGLNNSFTDKYTLSKQVFEKASDFMKYDIAKVCYSGTLIDEKWKTICLITHCVAIYKVFESLYGIPAAFTGYSQGEFAACTASGVFEFPEILGLVYHLECLLYSDKCNNEGMFRLVDITTDILMECCHTVDNREINVNISAYISDTQNIISGKLDYVKKVIELAKLHGARWAIDLHADRAYHSSLCNNPAQMARPYFEEARTWDAIAPVYSCYDGMRCLDGAVIKDKLSMQINHPIQWSKIITNAINDGILNLVELGPGCTVSANTRIADSRMNCRWVGEIDDLW